MTTTTTADPVLYRLGPPDLDRDSPRRGFAGVRAGLFHVARAGGLRGRVLADGRHRNLPDVSPAPGPPELRHPAPVARICPDRHRLLCLRGRPDRLGVR